MKNYNLLACGVLACVFTTSLAAVEYTYTEQDNSNNNIALGFPVPLPVDSLTPVDGFRSYQSLDLRHKQLTEQASWLTSVQIGETLSNRPIWAYQISDDNNVTIGGAQEGSALINGGIHAREWQSPEAVTGYIENLYDNQSNQHIEQYIIENLNLVVIPVLNIDGFLQTQRFHNKVTDSPQTPRDGRMRRKNMRDVDEDLSTTSDNLLGIDLNRNNNPYWATNSSRSSSDNTSLVHHGDSAASEPETQALQQAADVADGSRLRFYTDTHSFSQIYFTPMTGEPRRDAITGSLASIMRAANNFKYRYGPSNSGGGIGATDEYFANTYDIPSYTLEIEPLSSGTEYGGFGVSHDGFILPAAEVSRMRAETSKATFAGLYALAEQPYLKELIIKSGDEVIYQLQWQVQGNERILNTIIETPLQANTQYQLTTVFNKPMRDLENNEVVNFSTLSSTNGVELSWHIKTTDSSEVSEIDTTNGNWLTSGFSQYKTDSYQVDFTLPEDLNWQQTTLFALNIETVDMAGQNLDSNPATISDWQSGHWENYEDDNGNNNDQGGTDKSMRLINDGSDLYADDDDGGETPTTPTTPTTPAPDSGSSSSGGSLFWLLIFAVLPLIGVRRKRLTQS